MSVEENKRIHQTIHEEFWMKGNVDIIDDLVAPDAVFAGMRGHEEIKRRAKENFANPETVRATKVGHHAKISEGDYLAIWQTNHMSDGTTREGVTIQRYENGKLVETRWFLQPYENQQSS